MRKLILSMTFALCTVVALAQDKQDPQSFFIRVGGGFGQRLAQLPPQIDANGRDHYGKMRSGFHTNLQVGYLINHKVGIGAIYSRFGSKNKGISNGVSIDSKDAVSFAGVTINNIIPISDKHDINFNTRVGPGLLFYNTQNTLVNAGVTTFSDLSDESLGLFTGVSLDYRIANNLRFEINVDKTWGRLTINKVKTNLEYIALGVGLRFQF